MSSIKTAYSALPKNSVMMVVQMDGRKPGLVSLSYPGDMDPVAYRQALRKLKRCATDGVRSSFEEDV